MLVIQALRMQQIESVDPQNLEETGHNPKLQISKQTVISIPNNYIDLRSYSTLVYCYPTGHNLTSESIR